MTKSLKAIPPQDVQIADQLVTQYQKAVGGTIEILKFGCMFMQLRVVLELQNNSHGPGTKGDGLKGWIEEFCPEINYNTAYGFYRLAKGMRQAMQIPPTTNLHKLLTASPEELTKRETKLRKEIDAAIAGKSARQLEFDFGIRIARTSRPDSGGAREGAGRPKETNERMRIKIEAAFSKELLCDLSVAVLEKRWHLRLGDEKKELLLAIAERLVADLGVKS